MGTSGSNWSDEDFGRDAEAMMEAANHREPEGALTVHHFVHPAAPADHADQRMGVQPLLLEAKANRLDRIGWIDRKVLAFVRLGEGGQNVEPVAVGSTFPGSP
jgi:hypothetical protein